MRSPPGLLTCGNLFTGRVSEEYPSPVRWNGAFHYSMTKHTTNRTVCSPADLWLPVKILQNYAVGKIYSGGPGYSTPQTNCGPWGSRFWLDFDPQRHSFLYFDTTWLPRSPNLGV